MFGKNKKAEKSLVVNPAEPDEYEEETTQNYQNPPQFPVQNQYQQSNYPVNQQPQPQPQQPQYQAQFIPQSVIVQAVTLESGEYRYVILANYPLKLGNCKLSQ